MKRAKKKPDTLQRRANYYGNRGWINRDYKAVATSGWLDGYNAALADIAKHPTPSEGGKS
jgi:hypothetical protein